jgi:hypothetical protein
VYVEEKVEESFGKSFEAAVEIQEKRTARQTLSSEFEIEPVRFRLCP